MLLKHVLVWFSLDFSVEKYTLEEAVFSSPFVPLIHPNSHVGLLPEAMLSLFLSREKPVVLYAIEFLLLGSECWGHTNGSPCLHGVCSHCP